MSNAIKRAQDVETPTPTPTPDELHTLMVDFAAYVLATAATERTDETLRREVESFTTARGWAP